MSTTATRPRVKPEDAPITNVAAYVDGWLAVELEHIARGDTTLKEVESSLTALRERLRARRRADAIRQLEQQHETTEEGQ